MVDHDIRANNYGLVMVLVMGMVMVTQMTGA